MGDGEEVEKTRTDVKEIDEFLDKSMEQIEALICNTYRKCCYEMGNSSVVKTCTAAHGGASVGGAAQELSDPSSPNFCQLVSGSDSKRGGGAHVPSPPALFVSRAPLRSGAVQS